jgi:peptidoglycan-associated lipoprotein
MKRILYLITLALICGALALGCAKTKVVSPDEDDTAKTEETAEETKEAEVKEADDDVAIPEEDVSGREEITRVEPTVDELKEALAAIKDVYFDYDRYEIRKEAQTTLSKIADVLVSRGGSVVIEGHCDDRGTNEYNLALGDRRASAAKDFLIASGVSPSKIGTVSYGEERPQCRVQRESCWSKNRRAHFKVSGID